LRSTMPDMPLTVGLIFDHGNRTANTVNFQVFKASRVAADDEVWQPGESLANVVGGFVEDLALGITIGWGLLGDFRGGKIVKGGNVGEDQQRLS